MLSERKRKKMRLYFSNPTCHFHYKCLFCFELCRFIVVGFGLCTFLYITEEKKENKNQHFNENCTYINYLYVLATQHSGIKSLQIILLDIRNSFQFMFIDFRALYFGYSKFM